jgi:hypothetical protein
MSLFKSSRPQNLHPDALIRSRKDVAKQNHEAVRVAVQAMRRRNMRPQEITVQAVAKESGVSVATIYRRGELFALVRNANPELQRRQAKQVYREDLQSEKAKATKSEESRDYYQREAELAKLGTQGVQQENVLLRKKLLKLQREIDDKEK